MFEIICVIICVIIIAATVIICMLINRSCKHEWTIIDKVMVDTDGCCDYDRIYIQCKKCGQVSCKVMK